MSDQYLGESVKKLGFGLMRLPRTGKEIDIGQVKTMVDLFMAAGGTYFDTAWAYRGSEEAIREALVKRYPRGSFTLATKNAAWVGCKTREDAIAQFETSLERSGAGYFDFYLLHNLGETRTRFFEEFGLWDYFLEKKKEGKIRHLGFSFHSTPDELEAILQAHPEAEFVQLQINYADWESPAIRSRENYEVARRYHKPVVIMEPVKGGMLANPPESVKRVFDEADPDASCASWAIRFAASLPGILTVLSGMSSVEQMQDNLSFLEHFKPLSEEERGVVRRAQEELAKIPLIPCTTCNYCAKVCPKEIGISGTFTAMNLLTLYRNKASAKHQEEWLVGGHGRKPASECVKCGKCETVCPQHIEIRKELERSAAALNEG